jgi:hypothetical protein
MMAGATGELIDKIAEQMVKERKIKPERAEQLLALYQK